MSKTQKIVKKATRQANDMLHIMEQLKRMVKTAPVAGQAQAA